MDLRLLLDMAVAADPERDVVTGPEGSALTAGELAQLAGRASHRFLAAGQPRVGYLGPNDVSMPVTLFGAVLAGLPFVPLNYRLGDSQLRSIVAHDDSVVVAAGEQAERVRRLGVRQVVDPATLLADRSEPVTPASDQVSPDDVAVLIFTSGTTAAPKAALLRHRHLASYVIGTVEFGAAEPGAAALLSVPPYHIAGVMNLLTNLYLGRRVVYLDPFDPARWLAAVKEQAVTHAMVVPTMLARIVAQLDGVAADVPSLRSISYGGAKMPQPVIERALALFPHVDFTNAYGLTETSSTITVLGPVEHRAAMASEDPAVRARLGSAGLPVPGIEVEVRDEDGRRCPTGQTGDIYVRGDQVAGEYVGAAAGDDWFATRDRGHVDEEGYLFIEGRADDTIIRGGENIAPAEIEDVLMAHPAVVDCAVVGLDDEEWGQRIAAAVVLAPGSAASPDELRTHARARLRTSKTPDLVVVVPTLPYTETGKLLRRTVRQQLATSQSAATEGTG